MKALSQAILLTVSILLLGTNYSVAQTLAMKTSTYKWNVPKRFHLPCGNAKNNLYYRLQIWNRMLKPVHKPEFLKHRWDAKKWSKRRFKLTTKRRWVRTKKRIPSNPVHPRSKKPSNKFKGSY